MKKTLVLGALMSAFGLTMAQQVTTYSVYDTNHNGEITVSDVTETVTQITNNVAAASTQQYVTAEDLSSILKNIQNDLSLIKAKLGIETSDEDPSDSFNGHAYVDLGITDANGKKLLWATCNVGATNPEDYGSYFAWGETTTKSTYDWSTYKYCKGSKTTLTKYCDSSSYGYNSFIDSKTVLEAGDDAATANWGGSWRMPTYAEQTKLRTECYWQWVTSYNGKTVNGYVVYKKKSSGTYSVTSDSHIFLPASGYRSDSSLNSAVSYGNYWSSSLYESYPDGAYYLDFNSTFVDWYYTTAAADYLSGLSACLQNEPLFAREQFPENKHQFKKLRHN